MTKKEPVVSTSSQSIIPLSVPTKKINNKIDEQMEVESDLEHYEIKLKNIKIEFNNWSKLVADKRKEYEELTAMCNKKCTVSVSNPSKVVASTRKISPEGIKRNL